jgi:MFS family permease
VVATLAIFLSAPLIFMGLSRPRGDMVGFVLFAGLGMASMYVYYATVYSAIQDVIEPSLRGTAMALYFFAMYVMGASLGPVGMGFLSSHFTRKAALAAGVTDTSFLALRPFAAEGLHSALFVVPVFGLLLGLVLFAASRTVTRDTERLQHWMRESASNSQVERAVVDSEREVAEKGTVTTEEQGRQPRSHALVCRRRQQWL